jgi:hypothetical protein
MKTIEQNTETDLRELDAWIGIKLFGRKWYRFDDHICQLEKPATWQKRQGGDMVSKPGAGDEIDITSVPRYSTDRDAAMLVQEKCAEKLDGFEMVIGSHSYHALEKAKFMVCTSNHRGHQSIADTLPLAICRFAQKLFSK